MQASSRTIEMEISQHSKQDKMAFNTVTSIIQLQISCAKRTRPYKTFLTGSRLKAQITENSPTRATDKRTRRQSAVHKNGWPRTSISRRIPAYPIKTVHFTTTTRHLASIMYLTRPKMHARTDGTSPQQKNSTHFLAT